MFTVSVSDDEGGTWTVLSKATAIEVEDHAKKPSKATFLIPKGATADVSEISLDYDVKILDRDSNNIFQGKIVAPLDISQDPVVVDCVDYAIYLSRLVTPYARPLNNEGNTILFSDLLEDLLHRHEPYRWVTEEDFNNGSYQNTEAKTESSESEETTFVEIDTIVGYAGEKYYSSTVTRTWTSEVVNTGSTPSATSYGHWGFIRVSQELDDPNSDFQLEVEVQTSSDGSTFPDGWTTAKTIDKGDTLYLDKTHSSSHAINVNERQYVQIKISFENHDIAFMSPRLYALELIVFKSPDISEGSSGSWSTFNTPTYDPTSPSFVSHTRAINSMFESVNDASIDEKQKIWKVNADKELIADYGIDRIFYTNLSGSFNTADTLTGSSSGATADVDSDNGTDTLNVSNITSSFEDGETITGSNSGATATVATLKRRDNVNIDRVEKTFDGVWNDVIGLGSGSGINQLISTTEDSTSITNNGRRTKVIPFRVDTSSGLDSLVAQYLANHKDAIERIFVEGASIDLPGTVECGDTVMIYSSEDNIEDRYRVLKKVTRGTSRGEIIKLELSSQTDVLAFNLDFIEDYLQEERWQVATGDAASPSSQRKVPSPSVIPSPKVPRIEMYSGIITGVDQGTYASAETDLDYVDQETDWTIEIGGSEAWVLRVVNESSGSEESPGDAEVQIDDENAGVLQDPFSGDPTKQGFRVVAKRTAGTDSLKVWWMAQVVENVTV